MGYSASPWETSKAIFESAPVLFKRRDVALFQQSLRLRRSDVYLDLQNRKFLQEFDTHCSSREFIVVAVLDMPINYKSISIRRRNIRPLNLLEVRNFQDRVLYHVTLWR